MELLRKAVADKRLADAASARRRGDGVAGVGDVPAPPDVVRVQDVEAEDCPVRVGGDGGPRLPAKEGRAGGVVERFLLREGVALFEHGVPDRDHCG
jgi:hypothetical protein